MQKVEILTLALNVKGKATCCLVRVSFHCPLSLSLSVLPHRAVLRRGHSDAHCTTWTVRGITGSHSVSVTCLPSLLASRKHLEKRVHDSLNTVLLSLWKLLGVLQATLNCSLSLSQARTAHSNCRVPMGQLRARGSHTATPITPTARGPSPRKTSTGSSSSSSPSPWRRTSMFCRCLMARPSQRTCEPGTTRLFPTARSWALSQACCEEGLKDLWSSAKTSVFMRPALNSFAFFIFSSSFLLLRSAQWTGLMSWIFGKTRQKT